MKRSSDLRTSCKCFLSLSNIFTDTVGSHATVMFEEERCTTVAPKERVINFICDEGDGCEVKWANK